DRAHVDDAAPVPRRHELQGLAGAQEGAVQVYRRDPAPGLVGEVHGDCSLTRSPDPGYWLEMPATRTLLLAVTLLTVGGPGEVRAGAPSAACQRAAAVGVATCTATVASLARRCYLDTGAPCPVGDTKVTAALAKLDKPLPAPCPA